MSNRCFGHCCENVILPASPADLWSAYQSFIWGGAPLFQCGEGKLWIHDVEVVAPMLQYKGVKRFHYTGMMFQVWSNEHVYRCKWHNGTTGDCEIYESRPSMCRRYPEGLSHGCNDPGCTWDEVKDEQTFQMFEV